MNKFNASLFVLLTFSISGCSSSDDPCEAVPDNEKTESIGKMICDSDEPIEFRQLTLALTKYIRGEQEEAFEWSKQALEGDYTQIAYRYVVHFLPTKYVSDPANFSDLKSILEESGNHGNIDHLYLLMKLTASKTPDRSQTMNNIKLLMLGMTYTKPIETEKYYSYEALKDFSPDVSPSISIDNALKAQSDITARLEQAIIKARPSNAELDDLYEQAISAAKFETDTTKLDNEMAKYKETNEIFEKKKAELRRQADKRKDWPTGAIAQLSSESTICISFQSALKAQAIDYANNHYISYPDDCRTTPGIGFIMSVDHLAGGISQVRMKGATMNGYIATDNIM